MRFTGKNTSATNYTLRAQNVLEAKSYSIAPGTTAVPTAFTLYVPDDQVVEIRAQLDGCSGVTYVESESTAVAKLIALGATAPATASATGVHAGIAGNSALTAVTTGITNPVIPRNITITPHASWDGGDIVITGTDQFGNVISETIADTPGSLTAGVKIFATVTSVAHLTVGASATTCTIGFGNKLGIPNNIAGNGILFVTGAVDATATYDATYDAVEPSAGVVPNAARVYLVLVNVPA